MVKEVGVHETEVLAGAKGKYVNVVVFMADPPFPPHVALTW